MLELVPATNYYIALASIGGQIVIAALVGAVLLRRRIPLCNTIVKFVGDRGLLIAFLAALFAAFMTLFYSEVIGFEPCPLCWWQRVFLYPQVVIFGMALWKKDYFIIDYSIVLSVFGLGVALYQHALQMFGEGSLPCPATGVSCAQRVLFEFGYITFPFLAVVVFIFLLVVAFIVRAERNL